MDIKRTGTFKKEYNKLSRIFKYIDKDNRELIDDLITTAAFASSEMEKCIVQIQDEGSVVLFKNGKQEFQKKHPAFDVYTKLQGQYLTTMKELAKYLADDDDATNARGGNKNEDNPIDNMISGVRDRRLKIAK